MLSSTIAGVRYRRSRRSDAAALAHMMELGDAVGDGLPTPRVFRVFTERDFAVLIESAMISVTAVRDASPQETATSAAAAAPLNQGKEVVVGFISLDDTPPQHAQHDDDEERHIRESVQAWVATRAAQKTKAAAVTLNNSLWLRMLLAPASAVTEKDAHRTTTIDNNNNSIKRTAELNAGGTKKSTDAACVAPRFSTQEIAMDLLRATLGSLSGVEHIFLATGGPFACVDGLPGLTKLPTTAATAPALHHLPRTAVLPPLTMRQGRVEDYDDAVTLLVAGGPGVITELPAEFYLEELLQSQDAQHKVVVAEDSVTHVVAGLACVRQLEVEEQQYLARLYNTDMFERLKPLNVDGSDATGAVAGSHTRAYQDGRTPSGTASIFFLYFNPAFEHSAYQLLPYIFREFPTCDYAALQRPHTQTMPEPMVLERFQYMPLRRYQPHNARGEVAPPPGALWVCPRVSLEAEAGMQAHVVALTDPACAELRAAVLGQFSTTRAASPAGSGVHAVMHHQQQQQSRGGSASSTAANVAVGQGLPGCSAELLHALREDLADVGPGGDKSAQPHRAVFALSWGLPASSASASGAAGRSVVGVLAVQPLSVGEVYALRANYDLDRFLSFNTAGGFDYAATDIALTAAEGPLRYRSAELPGLAVRFAYLRPAFRHHLKFFLREVLRQTRSAVLLNLTSVDASLCQTTLSSFTYVPPRRVVETGSSAPPPNAGVPQSQQSQPGGTTAEKMHANYAETSGSATEHGTRLTDGIPEVNDVTPALTRQASAANRTNASTRSATTTAGSTTPSTAAGLKGKTAAAAAAAASLALSSLFFTTRRLLCDERVRVHPRLVVVGASATALAMLYELFKVPYVDLLNVTLIATDGVPQHPNQAIGDSVASRLRQQQLWQADAMELLEREYMRLRLGDGFNTTANLSIGANVVRVVQGTLVDIDTNLKFVQLENGVYEPYDHLVLATGRQYLVPPAIRALQQQEARSAHGGVVALSGVLAEDKLRHALTELNQSNATSIANVVVYGSGLDAIAALSTMISTGFPAQRLVLCRPEPDAAAAAAGGGTFADLACAEAALALFRVLGVTVLDGYGVSRLEFDDDALSSVLLASLSYERKAGDAVELPCSMIVCLEDKDIDHSVLSALTKRSIVFDGRVIVGANYETSQPGVLAVGPVAMFTRRYGATESFEAYCARDVGRDVAHVLLGRLGLEEFRRGTTEAAVKSPDAANGHDGESGDEAGEDLDGRAAGSRDAAAAEATTRATSAAAAAAGPRGTLPTYDSPVARRVRLPCHYEYFSAVRGAAQFRPEECIRLDYSSTDMLAVSLDDVQTGVHSNNNATAAPPGSSSSGGHCVDGANVREMLVVFIHRRQRTIDGVVYFGNGAPPVHNYRALIGLPESLFHLEFRYNEALEKAKTLAQSAPQASHDGAMHVGDGVLTAPIRHHKLDLVAYLRLPLFHPLLCDSFVDFFAQLRRDTAAAEAVVATRERVVRAAEASGKLSAAEAAAQVAELTDTKKAFRYKVQLALLKYLHETKDRRPQNMFLPSIEKQVSASRSTG